MSMNPPAPEPTRTQQLAKTTARVADRYLPVIIVLGGIIVGFILGRV